MRCFRSDWLQNMSKINQFMYVNFQRLKFDQLILKRYICTMLGWVGTASFGRGLGYEKWTHVHVCAYLMTCHVTKLYAVTPPNPKVISANTCMLNFQPILNFSQFQLVLSVATLLQWWKIWFIHDKLLKFYSYSYKNMHSDGIYVSVGIVRLLRFRARQCTSTSSLQNGCIFRSQDAWLHVPMLLSADIITIFH